MEEKILFRSLLAHCDNMAERVWRGLPALPELDALFRSDRTAPPRAADEREQAVLDELANEPDALEQGLTTAEYDVLYQAAIRFPFVNWQPSRFSDGQRFGVWYAARERRTAVRECAQGLIRGWLDAEGTQPASHWEKRYLVRVQCDTLLADLVHAPLAVQWRGALTADDHAFCQRLGAEAVRQVPGLLYPSAREHGGQCVGVFNEDLVSAPEPVDAVELTVTRRAAGMIDLAADGVQWRIPTAGGF